MDHVPATIAAVFCKEGFESLAEMEYMASPASEALHTFAVYGNWAVYQDDRIEAYVGLDNAEAGVVDQVLNSHEREVPQTKGDATMGYHLAITSKPTPTPP